MQRFETEVNPQTKNNLRKCAFILITTHEKKKSEKSDYELIDTLIFRIYFLHR